MKAKRLLFIAIMVLCVTSTWAYDFSAVAPTGQTLYFDINGTNVEIVPEYTTSPYYISTSEPSGALTIPSTVDYDGITYTVTSIGNNAFYQCQDLISIAIPNTVVRIGNNAFRSCSGLTSVTIPNSVVIIGNCAFGNCSGITSVTIPDSLTFIGSFAFQNCGGLTSVTIPDTWGNTGWGTFHNCTSLTSVTIPNSVTRINGYAFSGCSGLTSVTIPSSVTHIEDGAFQNCTGLMSVLMTSSIPPSLFSIYADHDHSYAFSNNASNRSFWVYADDYPAYYSDSSWSIYREYIHIMHAVYDTLVVVDTLTLVQTDTLWVTDTVYIHDTTYVNVPYPVHDTNYINVPYPVHDTTYVNVPYPVHDTTVVTDTLWLTQYDTIWLHDTIIIHDTIYITQEGIGGAEAVNAKVYSSHGQIVVEGAMGNTVTLYDVSGRMLATKRDDGTRLLFDVPASGTYMIKIGDVPARKVVVIR